MNTVGKASSRRGASGIWMVLGGFALVLLMGGGCMVGKYNGMISSQESVDAKWSNIHNMYKRRFDLIPQLVATVKGAAEFEKSTIVGVTEARAAVGKLQLPASLPDDPAAIQKFFAAQQGLGSALSRLIATVENYPSLKATAGFRDLQSQIEGTENRIGVARTDYIEAVASYNTTIRRFPNNLLASTFGFEKTPQLEMEEGVTEVPTIDFGGGE